jgi:putative transposase
MVDAIGLRLRKVRMDWGKPEIEAACCRADAGQYDVAGRALKKMVKPSRRGPLMERQVQSLQMSERRACRVLYSPRATYCYLSCVE